MGSLVSAVTNARVCLRAKTLIGRDPRADLVLTASGASGQHASIYWDGIRWRVRDLSSRNGTKVNEVLLQGSDCALAVNDVMTFGDPLERWRLADIGAPTAFALAPDGRSFEGSADALFLLDENAPSVGIYRRQHGWELESALETRPIHDRELLELHGVPYRLTLPAQDQSALLTQTMTEKPLLASTRAEVSVSPDQEFVSIVLRCKPITVELPPRACAQVLLLLARAHEEDRAENVAPPELGWRYADAIAQQLRISVDRLNVDIHRLRRLVDATRAFGDADQIVQRRRTTGQIRIGTGEALTLAAR